MELSISMEQLSWLVETAARTGAQAALAVLKEDDQAFQKLGDDVKQIVTAAALQGVDELERAKTLAHKKESSKVMDRRLYNTRLLLKHYRELKLHFENAVFEFDAKQIEAESEPGAIWEILNRRSSSEEVYVESIRKSAMRTALIIQHIDLNLRIYSILCDTSNMESEKRQYRILSARYLSDTPMSIAAIAEQEHIHRRTAEKDLDSAIAVMTGLIFGVEGIKTK